MKFLTMSLIVHAPDPRSGVQPSATERFRQVVDAAMLAEELGFDGFAVGERHERPFLSSSPTVVLSHIAAKTSRIKLFTAVTTLSLLDPVRAYEDYATLDHLSGGRLELIIGKGNGSAQRELFHVTPEDQWERNAEAYDLFRRIWRQDKVTATPKFRPALTDAEIWPRPLQQPIRVWHGSATSKESVDLAASYGDPLFSANVTNPIGLSVAEHRASLERFQGEIAPVLRREIPDPSFEWGVRAAVPDQPDLPDRPDPPERLTAAATVSAASSQAADALADYRAAFIAEAPPAAEKLTWPPHLVPNA